MKTGMNIRGISALIASCMLAFIASSTNVNAQNAKASGWYKTCDENDGNKICQVQFQVVSPKNQLLTSLAFINFSGEVDTSIFRVVVPTGRTLPNGIQIQVDGKNASVVPYTFCRPRICAAEVKSNDSLINVFKNGGKLEVTSINFQGKPNPVPVTLKGFTAAYDGEPRKREESRQEILKKQLEEKLKAGEAQSE